MKKYRKNLNFILGSIFVLLFIIWAVLVKKGVLTVFDSYVYEKVIAFKSNSLTGFMKFITNFASVKTTIILCVVSLMALLFKYKGTVFLVCNVIISTILNNVIKAILKVPRPHKLWLVEETGYSFPSGHSMAAISFYAFIIYLVFNSKLNKILKYIISIILSLLIVLIGISRVYLGVHNISDVIGAFMLSFALLMFTTGIINKKWRNKI